VISKVQLLSIVASLTLLLVILETIRKRRLREQYALVWLLTGFLLLLFSLWRDLLDRVSALMGIYYPPSALLLMLTGLLVLILLSFSIVVSSLSIKLTRLSQKLALLEWELHARARGGLPEAGAAGARGESSKDLAPGGEGRS